MSLGVMFVFWIYNKSDKSIVFNHIFVAAFKVKFNLIKVLK